METFLLWKGGPWDLPNPLKAKASSLIDEPVVQSKSISVTGTELIISKNLFDPERGEGRTRETEASSKSVQRIRGMVLLGTAILGGSRYAVVRDQASVGLPGQPAPAQSQNVMRLKLGDDVEGFKLSDIEDKRVVFTRGGSRVEVLLDYFRKDAPLPTPTIAGPVRSPGAPLPGGTAGPGTARLPVPGQVGTPTPAAPRVIPTLPRRERVPIPQRNQPQPEQ